MPIDYAGRSSLIESKISSINLDIEMETGTGKTYVYTKTIFELNRRYGWSKFIIVVPSIRNTVRCNEITTDYSGTLSGNVR